MCRLLGVVSRQQDAIANLLPGELPPFTALSAEHSHGWGVGWVGSDGAVETRKEPERASVSPGYAGTLDATTTDAAMLHIRQSSPGMPHVMANTHPFQGDGVCFAHNGYAWPNEVLDDLLGEVEAALLAGDTDSERYFSLVRAALRDRAAPDALRDAAGRITNVGTITSLNALLLTPRALYAMAWWDGRAIRAQPDGETERDYRLWYRIDPDRVVVASTGIPEPDARWQELPDRCVLAIDRSSLRVAIHDSA